MNWNAILGVACVVSFLFPVAVIIYNRYYTHRSLAALLVYYFILLIDNALGEGLIPSTPSFARAFGIFDNYTDVPLMLTALLFFCPSKQKQSRIQILTLVFIAYEIVVTFIYGFSRDSVVMILGPGVVLVLGYSSYLFVRQVRFSIFHGKNNGRMVMLAGIVFGYACYALIYLFHYIMRTPFASDVFKLYYISCIISSVLMAIGLHMMRRRMQELHSLRVTRKELAMFFGPQNARLAD